MNIREEIDRWIDLSALQLLCRHFFATGFSLVLVSIIHFIAEKTLKNQTAKNSFLEIEEFVFQAVIILFSAHLILALSLFVVQKLQQMPIIKNVIACCERGFDNIWK